jgi:hypothetical protein
METPYYEKVIEPFLNATNDGRRWGNQDLNVEFEDLVNKKDKNLRYFLNSKLLEG